MDVPVYLAANLLPYFSTVTGLLFRCNSGKLVCLRRMYVKAGDSHSVFLLGFFIKGIMTEQKPHFFFTDLGFYGFWRKLLVGGV
jgi:hypothetical protein